MNAKITGYNQYLRFWRMKEKKARITFHLPIGFKNTNHSCILAGSVCGILLTQPEGKERLRINDSSVMTIRNTIASRPSETSQPIGRVSSMENAYSILKTGRKTSKTKGKNAGSNHHSFVDFGKTYNTITRKAESRIPNQRMERSEGWE